MTVEHRSQPSASKTKPAGDDASRKPAEPDAHAEKQDGGNVEGDLSLPHERDQSSHMTDGVPSDEIRQASKDVARGLKDTSKGDEMDRAYQKQR